MIVATTLHDVEPPLEYLFSPHLEAIWPRKRVVLVSPELAVAAAPAGAGEQGGGSRRVSSHTSQRRAEELRRLARRRSVADDKFSLVGAKIAAPELRAAGAERAAMILVLSAPERGGGGGGGGSEGAPDLRRVGSLHLETGRSAQHWLLRGLLVLVGADADAA